jgi:regulator of sigma E protease
MGEVLFTIVTFLIAISALIAVHEFGHFWVAKKLGVKVLRYSIGFGNPVWKKKAGADNTEYVIAALPLGGYVKMLDEREGEVPANEIHRAFNRQSVWKRFAIVFAGPAFNFIFAFFAYWVVFVLGVSGVKPIIGDVYKDSPAAQAGLETGMEIVAVNNKATPIWDAVFQQTILKMVDSETLLVTAKDTYGSQRQYRLDISQLDLDRDTKQLFKALGIRRYQQPVPPVIGEVLENNPAALAGIQKDDRILAIDDQTMDSWQDVAEYISARPGEKLVFKIDRTGNQLYLELTTAVVDADGIKKGRAGFINKPVPLDENLKAVHQLGVIEAIPDSIRKTWDMSIVTLKLLGKIITGDVSIKNISGPLNIAVVVGKSADLGLVYFLTVVAIVSVSLGILNLLPIPVLDGGHLLFYVVEMLKGSPVSETVEAVAQRVGIALLMMLMILALYNDIMRFM